MYKVGIQFNIYKVCIGIMCTTEGVNWLQCAQGGIVGIEVNVYKV